MNKPIQTSLCKCIAKESKFKRFLKGNTYEYFTINTKEIDDYQIRASGEQLYFVKDPWELDSYIMFKKYMFNQMFVKLYGGDDKTGEFIEAIFEDNSKIINSQTIVEDKEVSNDHSFIEENEYR